MASLGLGDQWRVLAANDFSSSKASAYRTNFPSHNFFEEDVWDISADEIQAPVDLAWASSPCQDFSHAGTRKGFSGQRSSAFFGFWRIISSLQQQNREPQTIVLENVPGLLTSGGGADFSAVCTAFSSLGYNFGVVEIDAANFVPQSRQRIFLVATKRPVPKAVRRDCHDQGLFHTRRVLHAFQSLSQEMQERWIWWKLPEPHSAPPPLSAVLEPWNVANWHTLDETQHLLSMLSGGQKERFRVAQQGRERLYVTGFRRMRQFQGLKVQRLELRFDDRAGCLRTPGGGSSRQFLFEVTPNHIRSRVLSARECARLMGLPEDYILPKSANKALHLLGDGVVVDVVRWLNKYLLMPLCQREVVTLNVKRLAA